MSPVLADIKRVFDEYKREYDTEFRAADYKICDYSPFSHEEWMYNYLFPEGLISHDESVWNDGFVLEPCFYCSEEQVLRIMSEHGLL